METGPVDVSSGRREAREGDGTHRRGRIPGQGRKLEKVSVQLPGIQVAASSTIRIVSLGFSVATAKGRGAGPTHLTLAAAVGLGRISHCDNHQMPCALAGSFEIVIGRFRAFRR